MFSVRRSPVKVVAFLLTGVLALISVASCASTPAAAPSGSAPAAPAAAATKWKMYSGLAESYYFHEAYKVFVNEIKEKTNGQLEITVYPGGALGYAPSEIMSPIRDGLVPIAEVMPPYVSGEIPLLGLDNLPFLFPSREKAKASTVAMLPSYKQELQKFNAVPLAYWNFPNQNLWTKKPFNTVDDFKGVQLRSYSVENARMIELMGAKSVTIATTELYESLQRGLAGGAWTAVTTAAAYKFNEVLQYINAGMDYPVIGGMIVVNKAAFEKLPQSTQTVVSDAAKKLENSLWTRTDQVEVTVLKELQDKGMKVNQSPPELRQEATKRAATVQDEWGQRVGPLGRETLDKVRQILK